MPKPMRRVALATKRRPTERVHRMTKNAETAMTLDPLSSSIVASCAGVRDGAAAEVAMVRNCVINGKGRRGTKIERTA